MSAPKMDARVFTHIWPKCLIAYGSSALVESVCCMLECSPNGHLCQRAPPEVQLLPDRGMDRRRRRQQTRELPDSLLVPNSACKMSICCPSSCYEYKAYAPIIDTFGSPSCS